ncbi:MAG: DUF4079 domain-containing protein [Nitrospirota bacterium]|nr:MAG: DUF4079 domain-containing protein [Nitrospirota bacterium]
MAIDKKIMDLLPYAHGSYNLLILLMFFIQGYFGLKIRKTRLSGGSAPLNIVKRHRRLGPILAVLGVGGFFAGIILVYIDFKNILEFPIHLLFGVVLSVFIVNLFIVSRMIKGPEAHWRDLHYRIGISVLLIYLVQATLGLSIII